LLQFSESRIQRQVCAIENHNIPLSADEVEEEDKLSPAPSAKVVRAKRSDSISPGPATPLEDSNNFNNSLGSTSGEPLRGQVQEEMGQRFGTDFSAVRVHTDSQAVQMNRRLGARAFTYGADIYFNRGEFSPNTSNGRYLLAHELTHTLQQNGQTIRRLTVSPVGALTEGACGKYSRKWDFKLGAAAAEAGYIVQKLDFYEDFVACPFSGRCLVDPTLTFWEAWPVKKDDTFHEKHSAGYTDKSSSSGKDKKSGFVAAAGEVKFFVKSVSGDLGTYDTAPAKPNGGWGPNKSGQSGSLPSTLTEPSWWSSGASEGPAKRIADASWRCCGDNRDFNTIKADP